MRNAEGILGRAEKTRITKSLGNLFVDLKHDVKEGVSSLKDKYSEWYVRNFPPTPNRPDPRDERIRRLEEKSRLEKERRKTLEAKIQSLNEEKYHLKEQGSTSEKKVDFEQIESWLDLQRSFNYLTKISDLVLKESNYENAKNLVLELAAKLIKAGSATFWMPDYENRRFIASNFFNSDDKTIEKLKNLNIGFDDNNRAVTSVFKTGKYEIRKKEDVEKSDFVKHLDESLEFKTDTILSVPIYTPGSKDKPHAIMQCVNRQKNMGLEDISISGEEGEVIKNWQDYRHHRSNRDFSEEDAESLHFVSNTAGLLFGFIEQIKLARELRDERSKAVTEIADISLKIFEGHDKYTPYHGDVTANLSEIISKAVGLDGEKVYEIKTAGRLHDIGKSLIDQSLLHTRRKLSDKEFRKIRTHVYYTQQLLENTGLYKGGIKRGIERHHINESGGYPYFDNYGNILLDDDGLILTDKRKALDKGGFLPPPSLESKIVTIADSWTSLVDPRSYKESLGVDEAFHYLKKSELFDEDILLTLENSEFYEECKTALKKHKNVIENRSMFYKKMLAIDFSGNFEGIIRKSSEEFMYRPENVTYISSFKELNDVLEENPCLTNNLSTIHIETLDSDKGLKDALKVRQIVEKKLGKDDRMKFYCSLKHEEIVDHIGEGKSISDYKADFGTFGDLYNKNKEIYLKKLKVDKKDEEIMRYQDLLFEEEYV